MAEGSTSTDKKWWANALFIGAVVGFFCLPVGALGSKIGIWPFTGGFMLLAVGVVLATIVFFLSIVALVFTSMRNMKNERPPIAGGLAISVVVLALMFNQFMAARSVPPIHNISTDTVNPPEFDQVLALREEEGSNDQAYDTAALAELQQQAYPQVKPLISQVAQDAMIERVVGVLTDMGLEIVNTDESAGRVEATDETFWFGFKDDVVVRVRPEGTGSVVDIRSVSRVGQSDLGKNAARISEILAALQAN